MQQNVSNQRPSQAFCSSAAVWLKGLWGAVVILGLLVFAFSASAGNWYVRTNATGSANGTDWNNAWSMANLNASWASVNAGDTVWLAGGTYTTGMTPTKSGSAGNYIYIKRVLASDSVPSSAAGWSSAFDSQVIVNNGGNGILMQTPGLSYLYFDGRVDMGMRLTCGNPGSAAASVHIIRGANHLTFTNLDLNGPGSLTTDGSSVGNNSVNMNGDHVGIRAFAYYNSVFEAIDSLTVSHCRVRGHPNEFWWHHTYNSTVEYCKIYDNAALNSATWHGNMFINAGTTNITFRYNEIYNWQVEGIFYIFDVSSYWYIYGNLWHDGMSGTCGQTHRVLEPSTGTGGIGPIYFYNNTVVNSYFDLRPAQGTGYWVAGCESKNNIFYNICTSHNSGGINSANDFSGAINPFVNYASQDYHIIATTSAGYPRNNGAAITAVAGQTFNLDKEGQTRGADGVWDIGAFEYATGGPSTNPVISVNPISLDFGSTTTNKTVTNAFIIQNIGGGTLAGTASVAAPFAIVSGSSYSLGANQSQTVTVSFSPNRLGSTNSMVTFTGGGGMLANVSGTGVSLPPTVSAIIQSGTDVDPIIPGIQVYSGSVEQYSGSASDPNGLPLTWQWIYTVNGGAEVVFNSGTGTVASASFNYTTGTAGNTYVWKLRVSNGGATAESNLTVGVEAPPLPAGTLTFQATSGTITAPFAVTGGYISQSVDTGLTGGGQAVYTFTITNAGYYMIQTLVNAGNSGANSYYVNIDAQPQDPGMIWDMPVTSGFEPRIISWRGNGTDVSNQFVPQFFNLTSGTHQLIIVGREANVQLQSFSVLRFLFPLTNLHEVPPGN